MHDEGERDPRFQAWLAAGRPTSEPLAKSVPTGQRQRERARAAAGWPAGKRHEPLSAVITERALAVLGAEEPDLVLHLVTTHHGGGRPFFHVAPDADDRVIDVPVAGRMIEVPVAATPRWADHADRLDRLTARFGPWGLAALEAVPLAVRDSTRRAPVAQNFLACERRQQHLMPPSIEEWLPEGHPAWFVLDAVAQMDLSVFYGRYRHDGWGGPPTSPP